MYICIYMDIHIYIYTCIYIYDISTPLYIYYCMNNNLAKEKQCLPPVLRRWNQNKRSVGLTTMTNLLKRTDKSFENTFWPETQLRFWFLWLEPQWQVLSHPIPTRSNKQQSICPHNSFQCLNIKSSFLTSEASPSKYLEKAIHLQLLSTLKQADWRHSPTHRTYCLCVALIKLQSELVPANLRRHAYLSVHWYYGDMYMCSSSIH